MLRTRLYSTALLLALTVLLQACVNTRVNQGHPLVSDLPDALVARVYFIRPYTERPMGVADNRLQVELDRFPLLDMEKGQYTLLRLLPGSVWISANSRTAWGPSQVQRPMSRSQAFHFEAGKTYFVVFEPVDGEFRGVYFRAQRVELARAKALTRHMRAVGPAAKQPLSRL